MQSFLIVISHAAVRAGMRTDGSGNKGQCVLFQNDAKGLFGLSFLHGAKIGRHILMDRTSRRAGRSEAVENRKRFLAFSRRKGLDRFFIIRLCLRRSGKGGDFRRIHSRKTLRLQIVKQARDLGESLVSARFQHRGRHCHRPDARVHDLPDIEEIRAA